MSLVHIAFLLLKLTGYFTVNAGGGSNSCQAVHLVEGGRLRHAVIRRHVLFRAESTFPA